MPSSLPPSSSRESSSSSSSSRCVPRSSASYTFHPSLAVYGIPVLLQRHGRAVHPAGRAHHRRTRRLAGLRRRRPRLPPGLRAARDQRAAVGGPPRRHLAPAPPRRRASPPLGARLPHPGAPRAHRRPRARLRLAQRRRHLRFSIKIAWEIWPSCSPVGGTLPATCISRRPYSS